jgi:hypothetical protein
MNKDKILERKIYKKLKNVSRIREIKGSSSGCGGTYFQIDSKKGIKLCCEEYNTIKQAYHYFYRVNSEFKAAIETRKRMPLVPKTFSIKLITLPNGCYTWGIIQQHLGSSTLYDFNGNIIPKLRRKLKKVGIQHNDLHERNVMFYKGKHYVIDFGSIDIFYANK